MTKEQVEACFKRWGIAKDNLDDVKEKLAIIWFDNAGHLYVYPPNELHELVAIDWDNELMYTREFNKGFATEVAAPFDCIQKIVAKSDFKFESVRYQKEWTDYDKLKEEKDNESKEDGETKPYRPSINYLRPR